MMESHCRLVRWCFGTAVQHRTIASVLHSSRLMTVAHADADAAVMREIATATVHVENESVQLGLDAMVQLVALNPSFPMLVE